MWHGCCYGWVGGLLIFLCVLPLFLLGVAVTVNESVTVRLPTLPWIAVLAVYAWRVNASAKGMKHTGMGQPAIRQDART